MKRELKRPIFLGMWTLALSCAACQTSDIGQYENEAAGIAKPLPANTGEAPERLSIDQQVMGAVQELAERIGVERDAIGIKEARSVQWASGALGCPEPGMAYTEALVPGLQLLLEVDGATYHYHGASGKRLFFCPADRARAPAYGQGPEVM